MFTRGEFSSMDALAIISLWTTTAAAVEALVCAFDAVRCPCNYFSMFRYNAIYQLVGTCS